MAERKETLPFYGTEAWHRVRKAALMRDGGMCQECMRKFRDGIIRKPRRATMVHHKIPVKERPDLALELDNLESLCDRCHAEEHPEKYRRGETREAARREEIRRASGIRIIKV